METVCIMSPQFLEIVSVCLEVGGYSFTGGCACIAKLDTYAVWVLLTDSNMSPVLRCLASNELCIRIVHQRDSFVVDHETLGKVKQYFDDHGWWKSAEEISQILTKCESCQ